MECEDVVPPLPTEGAVSGLFGADGDVGGGGDDEYSRLIRTRNATFAARRKTVVGEGKSGVVMKGKAAANIVAVRRKPVPGGIGRSEDEEVVTKGTIHRRSDLNLPAVSDAQMLDCDEKDGMEDMGMESRNVGDVERDERMKVSEWEKEAEGFENAVVKAMKQTREGDLRRERRRKRREELAKGGSRDLSAGDSSNVQ